MGYEEVEVWGSVKVFAIPSGVGDQDGIRHPLSHSGPLQSAWPEPGCEEDLPNDGENDSLEFQVVGALPLNQRPAIC